MAYSNLLALATALKSGRDRQDILGYLDHLAEADADSALVDLTALLNAVTTLSALDHSALALLTAVGNEVHLTGENLVLDDTVWDDEKFPLTGNRVDVSGGRIDYDYANGAVGFQNTSRFSEEPISMLCQFQHRRKDDQPIHPHIHWYQQHATNIPNWLLVYKIIKNGTAYTVESDFSNHTPLILDHHVFTYASGALAQISSFPTIDTTGMTFSDMIHFALFRDSANSSGAFSGSDPSSITELVFEFDVHYETDRLGSKGEYVQ